MLESISTLLASIPGGSIVWVVLTFLIVFGILVFFHELGHYIAARSVGIRIETFSIGFGKELWGWNDKHGTRWKLALVPLGGYVAMHGFQSEDEKPTKDKGAFINKPVWARMWVVVAGPLANFILAVVCLSGLYMVGERVPSAVIGFVAADMPAAAAGLQVGDRVVEVNHTAVTTWVELVSAIMTSDQPSVTLTVDRQGQPLVLSLTPQMQEVKNALGETSQRPMIGIGVGHDYTEIPHGPWGAVQAGVQQTWNVSVTMLVAIKRMLFGQMAADIGGPILIAQQAGERAAQGLYELVFFMAFLSINLGLINLFPVPVLDGGHLLFLAIEGLARRPLPTKLQDVGHKIGGAMLITLMVFVFYKDIVRLIAG